MKTYKRRDSATAFLRKLDIKPRDYDLFITKTEDGVQLDDELAKQHAAKLKAQTAPKKQAKRQPKAPKTEGKACCHVAYELIKQGKTNQEVWDVIQPMFNLDDKKRHYPSWYRCHLRRLGEVDSPRVQNRRVEVRYE